ncbi:hypothetical protein Tcan_01342 [Toxocara canis]|uniref:Uncharacterized protein n=1 Tax=Toxocara canis TaxID=6265 RepID=A0A0B2UQJ0_TOXCA|nr:hypothetical protein Tcan_01342 [Toxocara canis]
MCILRYRLTNFLHWVAEWRIFCEILVRAVELNNIRISIIYVRYVKATDLMDGSPKYRACCLLSIFNLLRPSRSRSINNNTLACARPDPCCSSFSDTKAALSSSEGARSSSAHRRRRPRSAHYEPNSVMLVPEKVSLMLNSCFTYDK